jgi:hypothetical protein
LFESAALFLVLAGRVDSGRIVGNSDITQFWDYFRLGGDSTGTENSALEELDECLGDFALVYII